MLLLFLEDDDDLFLYEEDDFDDKAIDLAFGDNEMIEALIIILSHLFSRSLKLFFFFCVYFFFSLSSVLVFVSPGSWFGYQSFFI